MKCPVCESTKGEVLWTSTSANTKRIPRYLRDINVVRRRRACQKCGNVFWTIEVSEDAFQQLLFAEDERPKALPNAGAESD